MINQISSKIRSCLFTFIITCSAAPLLGEDSNYPLPNALSKSVIIGKRLKNPFAAKLRLSQAIVKDIVTGDTATIQQSLTERLSIRATMYFGPESERNRAIINGMVRRPADELLKTSLLPGERSIRLREIRHDSVLLEVTGASDEVSNVAIRIDKRSERKEAIP